MSCSEPCATTRSKY